MKLKVHAIANLDKTFHCSILHFVSYEMGFKYTSIELWKHILKKFQENYLPKDIASELQLNIQTVQRMIKATRESRQISVKKNSGRFPKSTKKFIASFFESIPRRIEGVLANKGYPTR